jgi:hypothetical protein
LAQRRIAVVLRIDANEMAQRWDKRLHLANLVLKLAVIEEPGRSRVVQELHVGIEGIAMIHGNPHAAGSHQPQHA